MQSQEDKPMTRTHKFMAVIIWAGLLWLGIKTGWLQEKLIALPELLLDAVTSDTAKLLLGAAIVMAVFNLIDKYAPRFDPLSAVLLTFASVLVGARLIDWISSFTLWLWLLTAAVPLVFMILDMIKERWIEQGRREERNR